MLEFLQKGYDIMHELKGGLNADKCTCYLSEVSKLKGFITHSFCK